MNKCISFLCILKEKLSLEWYDDHSSQGLQNWWNTWWCIYITATSLLMNVLSLIDNLLSFDSNAKRSTQGLTNSCKPVIGAMLRFKVWEIILP